MITLELSEDEDQPIQLAPLQQRMSNGFNVKKKDQEEDRSQEKVEEQMDKLNKELPDFRTLMPYSVSMVLEDLNKTRIMALQIVVKGQNTETEQYKLVIANGSMGSGAFFKYEIKDFSNKIVDCVQEFEKLFLQKTMNKWQEKDQFCEIPGYFKLYGNLTFTLHGDKLPTLSEEKKRFLDKLSFIELKTKYYNKENEFFDLSAVISFDKVSKLLKGLEIDEDLYFTMNRKTNALIWKQVEGIAYEIGKQSLSNQTLINLCSALARQLKSRKDLKLLSRMELKEFVSSMKAVTDLVEHRAFIDLVGSYLSTKESFTDFMIKSQLTYINPATDEQSKTTITKVFDNSINLNEPGTPTITAIYKTEIPSYEARFYPFSQLKTILLWKAFLPSSLPALMNNTCLYYKQTPSDISIVNIKGIPFYDCPARAIETLNQLNTQSIMLVLFEVAIGDVFELKKDSQEPSDNLFYHTIQVTGKMQPETHIKLDNQELPTDFKLANNTQNYIYGNNEYIVFDKNQYKPKYIVELKRHK